MWYATLAAGVAMWLMALWIKRTTSNISPLGMMIVVALLGGAIACNGIAVVWFFGDVLGATLDYSLPMLIYRGLYVLFGVVLGVYGAWLYGTLRSR